MYLNLFFADEVKRKMTEEWPPEGYQEPYEFKTSHWDVFGILFISAVGLLYVRPELATRFLRSIVLAMSDNGLAVALTVTMLSAYAVQVLQTEIHEKIHSKTFQHFGYDAERTHQNFLVFRNPSVVATETGIDRNAAIVAALAPFVILGGVSFALFTQMSGFFGALCGFVFFLNTVGSAQDIYTSLKAVALPRGALFANFETEEGHRSEVALPQSAK